LFQHRPRGENQVAFQVAMDRSLLEFVEIDQATEKAAEREARFHSDCTVQGKPACLDAVSP